MARELTQKDQEEAEKWMREDLGLETLPLCWGKDQTCINIGTHLIPEHFGLYCVNCANSILNN